MGLAFLFQVWQIVHSMKFMKRDTTGDPWGGRTLEWSLPSPAPAYNFATIPVVSSQDEWWEEKKRREKGLITPPPPIEPIHMPGNSGIAFIKSFCWFIAGFGFVFHWLWLAIPGLIGVVICMLVHSFTYNNEYYIPAEEVVRTEAELRGTI
ncbi:MAG: quinol oxidase subunit 1, partial [Paenibacillus sp.]|jgi:cytochrome aa3-600 menaquinol oxidase subunit 1|nr:quinol oxidase subunit 1 [Paenibacillus sp.]